ncbi:MAG: hypothetical protein WCH62_08990 [Candidatus Omnitrophota bacterium]
MAPKEIICNLCNGKMQLYSGPKFSRKLGSFLVVAGIFAIFFWIGPVLGIPLLLMGLYMVGAKRQLWVCKECNTAMERVEIEPQEEISEKKDKSVTIEAE